MRRALPALMVAPRLIAIAAMIAAGVAWGLASPTTALELREEPMSIAGDRTTAQDEPAVGENVGEPAAEDAPVEGEPGAGEAPVVPPDEQSGDGPGDAAPEGPPAGEAQNQ